MIEYIKAWSNKEFAMATTMFKVYGYYKIPAYYHNPIRTGKTNLVRKDNIITYTFYCIAL